MTLHTIIGARKAIITNEDTMLLDLQMSALQSLATNVAQDALGQATHHCASTMHALLLRKLSILNSTVTRDHALADIAELKLQAINAEIAFISAQYDAGAAIYSPEINDLYLMVGNLVGELHLLPEERQHDFLLALSNAFANLGKITCHITARETPDESALIHQLLAIHNQNETFFDSFAGNAYATKMQFHLMTQLMTQICETLKTLPPSDQRTLCLHYQYTIIDAFVKRTYPDENYLPFLLQKHLEALNLRTQTYATQIISNEKASAAELHSALTEIEKRQQELKALMRSFKMIQGQAKALLPYAVELTNEKSAISAQLLLKSDIEYFSETSSTVTPATSTSSPFAAIPTQKELFKAFDELK